MQLRYFSVVISSKTIYCHHIPTLTLEVPVCVKQIRNENSVYIWKEITHLQSGNKIYMELRNRSAGLRQQVQHSHHAEIPIQNSQRHSKCTLVRNK